MELNIEKIEREIKKQGISKIQLAEKMGKKKQWIYFVLGDGKNLTFKTVECFALALGVDPKSIIK